jgi:hypothetical protein
MLSYRAEAAWDKIVNDELPAGPWNESLEIRADLLFYLQFGCGLGNFHRLWFGT